MTAKKRKKKRWMPMLILIIIMGALLFVGWIFWAMEYGSAYYKAFGIRIPEGFKVHGIDVSKYQKRINWNDVADMNINGIGFEFCFIKATQGTGRTDPYFNLNWERSKNAGLIRGAYHYFEPGQDGLKQANFFLNQVDHEAGDLPPVLDIEEINGVSKSTLRKRLKDWLKKVEESTGVQPIIYTNPKTYYYLLDDDFSHYPLWIAHYHAGGRPRIFRNWHFWQHSESGRVNGIRGNVDFNVFSGDKTELRKLLIQ